MRREPAIIGFVSLTCGFALACDKRPVLETLSLSREFEWVLPQDFVVTGAAVSDSGSIALLSSNRSDILWFDRTGKVAVVDVGQGSKPVAAAFTSDSDLEIVDGMDGAIHQIDRRGVHRRAPNARAPARLVSATYVDGCWFLGRVDGSGNLILDRRTFNRIDAPDCDHQRSVNTALRAGQVRLSPGSHRVFAAAANPPFEVVELTKGRANPLPESDHTKPLKHRESDSDSDLWVALAVVQLDTESIQTFADLRSDKRLLLLRSANGKSKRSITLDAPVGIVASLPRAKLLLAVQRSSENKLIGYRWQHLVGVQQD
jgi:hypothetical protein